jgi:hypothetical protein
MKKEKQKAYKTKDFITADVYVKKQLVHLQKAARPEY